MAKDLYHNVVKRALEADGWLITKDPLTLAYGEQSVYVDLAADQAPFEAEKEGRKIAVEIKSFLSPSPITELERAMGQYQIYEFLLERQLPERTLYLAIPEAGFLKVFRNLDGKDFLVKKQVRVIVFNPEQERIIQWIL